VLKGDFQVTTVSEPGAIFGEISVLLDIPHMATVKALTASRAYVVQRADEFLQSQPDITYQLARLLAQRWMWPVSTMSGRYCSIHRTKSTSPKCFCPPQLVGDSSGGA
jgi:hypothetical protein